MRVALTPGEPGGIGPDLCLQLAMERHLCDRLVVFADPEMLRARAGLLGLDIDIRVTGSPMVSGTLEVSPTPCSAMVRPGVANSANADYVLETLRLASASCLAGDLDALVTGPVHKSAIASAGYDFVGHTGFLGELCGIQDTLMLLVAGTMRVALATVHVPLASVPEAITVERLQTVLSLLMDGLRDRFGVAYPQVLVAGLNPHAGEDGLLGDEELRVIAPVVEGFRERGARVRGPMSADSLIISAEQSGADAVLYMYHDQGLTAFKALNFGRGVNVTLGLPFIRTSVDHGTALELAGTGEAQVSSLREAVLSALQQIERRA